MEEPGRLNDFFDNIDSVSNDPQLEWENSSGVIKEALKRRKKKRRALIWWWTGAGSLIIVFMMVFTNMYFQEGSDSNNNFLINNTKDARSELQVKTNESVLLKEESDQLTVSASEIDTLSELKKSIHYNKNTISENVNDLMYDLGKDRGVNRDILLINNSESNVENFESVTNFLGYYQVDEVMNSNVLDKNSNADYVKLEILDASRNVETLSREVFNIAKLKISVSLFDFSKPNIPVRPILIKSEGDISSSAVEIWTGGSFNNIYNELAFAERLNGMELELGVRRDLNKRWFVSVGVGYGEDRFNVSFNKEDNINIYKPGTVDTIYQYSTGETLEVLRDSVPGLKKRAFGNTNVLRNITFPIHIGYIFSYGDFTIVPQVGIAPSLYQSNLSRIASNQYQVTDYDENKSLSLAITYRVGLTAGIKLGRNQVNLRYLVERNPKLELNAGVNVRYTSQLFQLGYSFRF